MTRNLFVLRGVPGSGKSTFVKSLGFEGLTVSPDELRKIIQQRYASV